MKRIYTFILVIQTSLGFAQNGFEVEGSLGYAFQDELSFAGEEVQGHGALGLRGGINYRRFLGQKTFVESGIHAKYVKANKSINLISFSSHNLSFQLPAYLGISVSNKWDLSVGMGVENNLAFQGISSDNGRLLRYDLLFKAIYNLKGSIRVLVYTNWMIGDNFGSYNIPNPRNGLYLGVLFPIRRTNKDENNQ